MDSYKDDNKQILSKLPEMTFEQLRNDTKASGLRNFCRSTVLFLIIVVLFGFYKYSTKIPDGVTNINEIMNELAIPIDNSLGIDIGFNKDQVIDEVNENRVFLYKNSGTDRFVFPIKDINTGKTHYCYLASYESPSGYTTKIVTDIDHPNWSRIINKKVAVIEGDNPAKVSRKYTIIEYYERYSSLYDEWLSDQID
ncbi:hypothetical protein ACFQAV_08910 [Companilactobacillus huachuanensis]|uniref:DUF4367 domain-containing protein n=1 Tax=Companilactobacillus huachuanensis TaxID=2559914 RepID=A0ABW1RPM0_9LACO|nr:hypothetical protein [Companilactobacillus huachuanensis]